MNLLDIKGTMTGLNDYVSAMNRNRHIGNGIKQSETSRVAWAAKSQLKTFTHPVHLTIVYREKNKKRDKDNIAFAKKFILDGLVAAGRIKNDGWAQVDGWSEAFVVDAKDPGITVIIKELKRR